MALVPLVVVLLALSGCSTNPATNITSTSATLNGDGNCPDAGHSFVWYYNLWDSQNRVFNGQQYLSNCSAPTGSVALPPETFSGLLTGAFHCFAIHVWYMTPFQEFMHFDADGTKNGYHFDCFTTTYVAPPDVIDAPPTNEATASGAPTSAQMSHTRAVAKAFWQGNGEWGSCMENNTRQTSQGPDDILVAYNYYGLLIWTTFNLLDQQLGVKSAALSLGCNSPGFTASTNPDARIIYNRRIAWGMRRHCVVGVHEYGHQRGYGHGTQPYKIMQTPAWTGFPPCQ